MVSRSGAVELSFFACLRLRWESRNFDTYASGYNNHARDLETMWVTFSTDPKTL